ncbi:acyl-CoA/acyl-ACP dehydrogenase [Nocardia salmonicida]|uniref:Acyl-CoA/acyl-ACP dehydrogenase n=1 Tax=Nocardia salmonicida TaxID=53431 RepID=A0ABZ1N3F6_9NOCA
MEFGLTQDQQLFRGTTKDFLEQESSLRRVRELAEGGGGFDSDWWRRGAELGWVSMLVSAECGGDSISGAGLLDMALVAEEMGRLVSPGPLIVTNVVAAALSESPFATVHTKVIERLMSGESVATYAMCEVDRGWDPAGTQFLATEDGDDIVLTGTKDRVESADQSEYMLVTARHADGLAQYLVPVDLPGVTITPLTGIDLVRKFARVRFDGVRVPRSALVGSGEAAEQAIERQLQIAIVLQCAELVGVVERVFENTLQWMSDRYSFGRPLSSYQALKHRVAEMKMWLEASHGTTAAAARAVEARSSEAAELVSIAKSYVGQVATDIVQDCIQLHGGIAITWEHDIHLYLRRATVNRVSWGTPSEHRERLATIIGV